MRAILMSIRPRWVAKILNREKTIEIRKKFPKDYVGWVYIYCTKNKTTTINLKTLLFSNPKNAIRNGKVVARFWCDKVEKIIDRETKEKNHYSFGTESLQTDELEKMSCLDIQELCKYIGEGARCLYGDYGYAIHITKLEIFDTPKELSEFWNNGKKVKGHNGTYQYSKLTRAPESYCYIEIE